MRPTEYLPSRGELTIPTIESKDGQAQFLANAAADCTALQREWMIFCKEKKHPVPDKEQHLLKQTTAFLLKLRRQCERWVETTPAAKELSRFHPKLQHVAIPELWSQQPENIAQELIVLKKNLINVVSFTLERSLPLKSMAEIIKSIDTLRADIDPSKSLLRSTQGSYEFPQQESVPISAKNETHPLTVEQLAQHIQENPPTPIGIESITRQGRNVSIVLENASVLYEGNALLWEDTRTHKGIQSRALPVADGEIKNGIIKRDDGTVEVRFTLPEKCVVQSLKVVLNGVGRIQPFSKEAALPKEDELTLERDRAFTLGEHKRLQHEQSVDQIIEAYRQQAIREIAQMVLAHAQETNPNSGDETGKGSVRIELKPDQEPVQPGGKVIVDVSAPIGTTIKYQRKLVVMGGVEKPAGPLFIGPTTQERFSTELLVPHLVDFIGNTAECVFTLTWNGDQNVISVPVIKPEKKMTRPMHIVTHTMNAVPTNPANK